MLGYLRKIKRMLEPKMLVLMYHKIDTPERDPWELSVSPQNFEQHLQLLQKKTNVLPLQEAVHLLQQKKLKRKSVALTFDDGITDNYTTAKPLLEKYNTPATFFITTGHTGLQKEFWWDELEELIVGTENLPQVLSFTFNDTSFYFNLEKESNLTTDLVQKHKGYIADKPPTLRTNLYFQLWQFFCPLTYQQQQQLLNIIKQWANKKDSHRQNFCAMSQEQLVHFAANPLFCLGGHTETHPSLAAQPKEVQSKEIEENKKKLEALIGKKVDLFAYPSGRYNDTTVALLQHYGYAAGFTTDPRPATKHSDLFRISRFQVNNWSAKQLEEKLAAWQHY